LVVRPRLLRRLDVAALDHRLTTIVGGPGTGKTTLLAQWSAGRRAVWHTAVPGESAAALMHSVIDGLADPTAEPNLELSMAADASTSLSPDENPARADALGTALSHYIGKQAGGEPVVLIVDDAHALGTEGAAAGLVAAIVRHAPETLRVVLATRGPLPFPTGRLLVDGLATEITGAELSFNAEEAAELIGDRPPEEGTTAADLLDRTGGWAVAIAFAARAADRTSEGDEGLDDGDRQLFAYFAEEVLAAETPATRAALRVAATLPWLTPELAAHLGLGEAGARLADPEWTSILMTPVADVPGAVTVTPLVRQLLRADRAAPGEVSVEHAAAIWYQAHGAHSAALSCLARQGTSDQLATFLRGNGQTMIAAGQGAEVLAALEALASSSSDPGVDLGILWAEALQAVGRADEAVERLSATVPRQGPIDAAVAWRLGALHYLRGDAGAASDVLGRVSLGRGCPADDAGCLAWTAAICWSRGERDEALTLAQRSLDLASRAGDDKALATAYTMLTMVARVDGDHVAQHRNYARSLEHAERAKDLLQLVRIRCNNGSHLTEDGEYAKALGELDVATRLADLGGYGMFRGLCLTNRAEALIATGRLDEAVSDLEAARTIFQQVSPSMDTYPLTLLGDIYMARGDRSLAVAAFEQAAAIATTAVEVQALVPALTGLALARLDDDPAAALDAATKAVGHEATVHHAKALIALGWVRSASGDRTAAVDLAERAGQLARERGDHVTLALALELAAAVEGDVARRSALLGDARSLWSSVGSPLGVARLDVAFAETTPGADGAALAASAADALDRLGARREAVRARAIAASAYGDAVAGVTVNVLGGFAVLDDGLPVPTSSWQSKVARDLLKMLAINRGRPIHREVLIERLWPGEFGDKASNRLSVALSAIRNATDPGRQRPSDHVVIADRDSVALNVASVTVDVDQFVAEGARGHALIRQGKRAQGLALLRLAEARYTGDVLEEQPYADWALPLREEALAMYLSVAAVLAEADAASGDHESSARRYLRMIERDPYSEHAYLGAVAALRAAGHHGTAHRLYATYVNKMTEMDIEPATFPAA
jgi:ATP/maltotriose-dependent transcriptional regulator MalT/DNA-binding SARP family transcriptional activator